MIFAPCAAARRAVLSRVDYRDAVGYPHSGSGFLDLAFALTADRAAARVTDRHQDRGVAKWPRAISHAPPSCGARSVIAQPYFLKSWIVQRRHRWILRAQGYIFVAPTSSHRGPREGITLLVQRRDQDTGNRQCFGDELIPFTLGWELETSDGRMPIHIGFPVHKGATQAHETKAPTIPTVASSATRAGVNLKRHFEGHRQPRAGSLIPRPKTLLCLGTQQQLRCHVGADFSAGPELDARRVRKSAARSIERRIAPTCRIRATRRAHSALVPLGPACQAQSSGHSICGYGRYRRPYPGA